MASDDEIAMKIDESFLIQANEKVLLRERARTGKRVYVETVSQNLARVFPKVNMALLETCSKI